MREAALTLPIIEEHREQVCSCLFLDFSLQCRGFVLFMCSCCALKCVYGHPEAQLRQAVASRSVPALRAALAHAQVIGVDDHDDEMDAQFRVNALFSFLSMKYQSEVC